MMHRLLLVWCIFFGSKLFCGNVIARPEQIEALRIISMIEIYPYLKLDQISKASRVSVNSFQIAERNYASIPYKKLLKNTKRILRSYKKNKR